MVSDTHWIYSSQNPNTKHHESQKFHTRCPTVGVTKLLTYFSITQYKTSYGSVSKPCTPVVHIKIAGDLWMFIPLKMVLIGIDPYPYMVIQPAETMGLMGIWYILMAYQVINHGIVIKNHTTPIPPCLPAGFPHLFPVGFPHLIGVPWHSSPWRRTSPSAWRLRTWLPWNWDIPTTKSWDMEKQPGWI